MHTPTHYKCRTCVNCAILQRMRRSMSLLPPLKADAVVRDGKARGFEMGKHITHSGMRFPTATQLDQSLI